MTRREEQALDMLRALLALRGATADGAVVLTVPGNPVPKARLRMPWGRAGKYTPSADAEQACAWSLEAGYRGAPLTGPVAAAFLFVRSDRRPCDTDNLVKLTKDSATGVCWESDAQVEWEFSGVVVGSDAQTVVAFAPLPVAADSRFSRPRASARGRRGRASR